MRYYLIFNDKHTDGLLCNELQLSQAKRGGGYNMIIPIEQPTPEALNMIQEALDQNKTSNKNLTVSKTSTVKSNLLH